MVLPKASRLYLMLMLLSSPSLAYASDGAVGDSEIDIELLEFLGDTAELESFGVDLDRLLGLDDTPDSNHVQEGGNDEN